MKKILLLSFFILTNAFALFAQVPSNDNCSGAILLSTPTTCSNTGGTNLNATNDYSTTCDGYRDVYYKFIAQGVTASVSVQAIFDAKIGVMSTCGGTPLACVDARYGAGTETVNLTGLVIGSTYYIKVQDYSFTAVDNAFVICVVNTSVVVAPVNDNCWGAIALTPTISCIQTSGTMLGATSSIVMPTCRITGVNSDVFYNFVANAPTASVSVYPSSGIDPILAVYSSCTGNSLGCIDATNRGQSETLNLTGLTVGSTYTIQIANYNTLPSTYSFGVCVVSEPVPPVNDECAGAILLTPASICSSTTGSMQYATTTAITTVCPKNYDIFYKFIAPATSATVTVVPSNTLDVVLGVLAACDATTSLACVDKGFAFGSQEVASLVDLTAGAEYYIKVSSYWNSTPTSNSTISVCVQSNPTTTSTQSSTALSAISMYPNPAQNVLNIENITSSTNVELIDMTGKTVYSENIDGDTQLNVSNYSAGVYILKLSVDGFAENRRVVISK